MFNNIFKKKENEEKETFAAVDKFRDIQNYTINFRGIRQKGTVTKQQLHVGSKGNDNWVTLK